MVVPIAPILTPIPKKERELKINMNEEAQIFGIITAVCVCLLLGFVALFWMLQSNAYNHSLHQRAHDKACESIKDETLKRDCLGGVHWTEHPEYAK